MAVLGLQEAAERIETSKVDVWRAIQAGRTLGAEDRRRRHRDRSCRTVPRLQAATASKRPVGQHATASLETSERPERIARLSEPAGERAKADKAIAKCAAWKRAPNPGGGGSHTQAAGQPGSACWKDCRGGHGPCSSRSTASTGSPDAHMPECGHARTYAPRHAHPQFGASCTSSKPTLRP